MDAQTLAQILIAADDKRARSRQKAIGVSSLGDCRRKVWHMSRGDEGTNPPLRLPALLGTAIHSAIEAALPTDDGGLIEHRVELPGLPPATIDYFKDGEVVDWKTIKMSGRDYFVTKQKRWQVQTYAYILHLSGVEVHTVTLVGIPRDGTEQDIIIHTEPFDPAIGQEALEWLHRVEAETEPPAPEREPETFCKKYCQFYGSHCTGIPKDLTGEPITDDAATAAAARYVEILAETKRLDAEKEAIKATLEGVSGITFDGIKVSWSSIAGRQTPDTEQISKLLGGVVPMKQGAPTFRLSVK